MIYAPKNISIIISTAGNPALVSRCLASFVGQLQRNDELIVVSKRKIPPMHWSTGAKIRFIHAQGSTKGQARNIGISRAKNTFIAFIDDDCIASPDWIKQIKRTLNAHITLVQGQTDNGEETNLWSTLENVTLHVYKNLPDSHALMEGAGIKLDTENLVINLKRIPFRPIFVETKHPFVHDDYLLLLKLNSLGIRPVFDESIVVSHMPNSTASDYLKKLIVDGRSDYWKAFVLKRKQGVLKYFSNFYTVRTVQKHPFNRRMDREVIQYIKRTFSDRTDLLLFYLLWYSKQWIRKIGFLEESVCQWFTQSTEIKQYLLS